MSKRFNRRNALVLAVAAVAIALVAWKLLGGVDDSRRSARSRDVATAPAQADRASAESTRSSKGAGRTRAVRLRSKGPMQGKGVASLAAIEPGNGCLFGSDARCVDLQGDLAACDGADPQACLRSAEAIGTTPPRDFQVAQVLFNRACKLGDEGACAQTRRAKQLVADVANDPQMHQEAEEQCEEGDAAACHAIIELHQWEEDTTQMMPALRRMCELGYERGHGCISLSMHGEPEAALWALEQTCNAGAADSCYLLARHLLGDGANPSPVSDLAGALVAYARACDLSPAHVACLEGPTASAIGGLPEPF